MKSREEQLTWARQRALICVDTGRFNDEEMTVLLTLAGPIDHQLRPQFLQEVAAELEVKRQAGEIGEGSVHRLARSIQRKYFTLSRRSSEGQPARRA